MVKRRNSLKKLQLGLLVLLRARLLEDAQQFLGFLVFRVVEQESEAVTGEEAGKLDVLLAERGFARFDKEGKSFKSTQFEIKLLQNLGHFGESSDATDVPIENRVEKHEDGL
jgi:hypothetical protein